MIENVLSRHFDLSVNQASPVQLDYDRTVKYDEDGNEIIVYTEVDYPSIVKAHGSVSDWSLESLLKAGIDPSFPITTGNPTRLEGLDVLSKFERVADNILNEKSE